MGKSKSRLEKSIKSHVAQVEEHTEKIEFPEKGDKNWNSKTPVAQNGLLLKWNKDRIRNAEEAAVEIEVWKERFGNGDT